MCLDSFVGVTRHEPYLRLASQETATLLVKACMVLVSFDPTGFASNLVDPQRDRMVEDGICYHTIRNIPWSLEEASMRCNGRLLMVDVGKQHRQKFIRGSCVERVGFEVTIC